MTLIAAFRQQVTSTAQEGCAVFATVMNNNLVNIVAGNSALLFPINHICLGCKLIKMIKLAQALLPCDHAPVEIRLIIFPLF